MGHVCLKSDGRNNPMARLVVVRLDAVVQNWSGKNLKRELEWKDIPTDYTRR